VIPSKGKRSWRVYALYPSVRNLDHYVDGCHHVERRVRSLLRRYPGSLNRRGDAFAVRLLGSAKDHKKIRAILEADPYVVLNIWVTDGTTRPIHSSGRRRTWRTVNVQSVACLCCGFNFEPKPTIWHNEGHPELCRACRKLSPLQLLAIAASR
jgi:hypothetical protein